MLYVPLLCFQHLCIDNYPFLMNTCIYRKTIAYNMHHLTGVSTADLVTGIEHLVFRFYKYYQYSRSSVVSSIINPYLGCVPFVFGQNPNKTHRRTQFSREICLQNKISEKPILVNDAELRDNISEISTGFF